MCPAPTLPRPQWVLVSQKFAGSVNEYRYGWEGIREVCATLLGARHVHERLCGGSVYLGALYRGVATGVYGYIYPQKSVQVQVMGQKWRQNGYWTWVLNFIPPLKILYPPKKTNFWLRSWRYNKCSTFTFTFIFDLYWLFLGSMDANWPVSHAARVQLTSSLPAQLLLTTLPMYFYSAYRQFSVTGLITGHHLSWSVVFLS